MRHRRSKHKIRSLMEGRGHGFPIVSGQPPLCWRESHGEDVAGGCSAVYPAAASGRPEGLDFKL